MSIEEITKERDELRAALVNERVGLCFAGSRYIAERLTIPADLALSRFGKAFCIEDGRIVAKDGNGSTILSRERMGEPADFDEALELIVGSYEHRDRILRGTRATGGGARGSLPLGRRDLSRAAFEALDASERLNWIRGGGTVAD